MTSKIQIKHLLINGRHKPLLMDLSTESVSQMKTGGLYAKMFPIPCGRCKGFEFHICKDGDDFAWACRVAQWRREQANPQLDGRS